MLGLQLHPLRSLDELAAVLETQLVYPEGTPRRARRMLEELRLRGVNLSTEFELTQLIERLEASDGWAAALGKLRVPSERRVVLVPPVTRCVVPGCLCPLPAARSAQLHSCTQQRTAWHRLCAGGGTACCIWLLGVACRKHLRQRLVSWACRCACSARCGPWRSRWPHWPGDQLARSRRDAATRPVGIRRSPSFVCKVLTHYFPGQVFLGYLGCYAADANCIPGTLVRRQPTPVPRACRPASPSRAGEGSARRCTRRRR